MPSYHCKIGTSDGRVVYQHYDSASRHHLQTSLEEQGFHVFQIRRQPLSFLKKGFSSGVSINGRRFLSFNLELLVLLRSGLPILQVFNTLIEQMEAGTFRDVISEVREDIRGGSSLSESFAKHPRMFPPLYIAALKAGERTGDLNDTLTRFLDYQKRVEAIRAKIRSASFYPLLLTSAAVVVVIFLMTFVVPRFTEIYSDAEVQLPLLTRVLIVISTMIGQYWPLFLLGLAGILMIFKMLTQRQHGQLWLARLKLRLPFFGPLSIEYALSAFSRTLGTILTSGTPLVSAMKMARGTLNNLSLEQKMVAATQRVEEGVSLGDALGRTGFYPPLALRMVRVGETSGSLSSMLNDMADYYESEVERRLNRLTSLIEPVLMMTMGMLIAFIIVAMYIPIFQLAATVG